MERTLILVLLTFTLAISACATTEDATPTSVDTPLIPETGGTATFSVTETVPAVTETAMPTETATNTPVPTEDATLAAGTDVTLMVNTQGTTPYLVDDQGRSLYAYMNDTQYGDTSACLDDCAVDWPPLVITDVPAAGVGVDIEQFGTIARPGGAKQVTFNGWPLYYSNEDTIPGSTNGQSYNGVWFLLSPSGDPIQQ